MTDKPPMAPVKGGVVPYLMIDGVMKALEFYQAAFGAEVAALNPPDAKGRTMHAHIYLNGASIMFSDPFPEQGAAYAPAAGFSLMLVTDHIDADYKRAVDAGCTTIIAITEAASFIGGILSGGTTPDLGQFFAPIADHDAPQTGHAVEEARAVTVIDGAALGAGDDGRAAQSLHQALVLLGRQVVGDVQTAKFLDVVIARLHERSSFCKILFWFWLRPSPRRARPRRR